MSGRIKRVNLMTSITQATVAIVGLAIAFWRSANGHVTNFQDVISAILILFATLFLVDRLGGLYTAYRRDEELAEREKTDRSIREIPALISRTSEITTFTSAPEALEHCEASVWVARRVYNMVLRYGESASSRPKYQPIYNLWLETKEKTASEGSCEWWEVVSTHFLPDDPQEKLIKKLSGKNTYKLSRINDKNTAIIQLTIIEFQDIRRPTELFFGWEYPDDRAHETCFLTTDSHLVDYYLAYFFHWFRLGASGEQLGHVPSIPLGGASSGVGGQL